MMTRLRNIVRDERGASIIEMALVAPFLCSLLIGMVDMSRGYSAKLQLEQAAQRSIEKAMNGRKDTTLYNTLLAEAMAAASVPANQVVVRYWLECNGVSQNTSTATMEADYERVCPDGQAYSRYVNVRIQKTFRPMFAVRWPGSNADRSFTLTGDAGIRVQ